MLSTILAGAIAASAGGFIGFVFGFGIAGHKDVLEGFQPKGNGILQFFCRPTREIGSGQSISLLLLGFVGFLLICLLVVTVVATQDWSTKSKALTSIITFVTCFPIASVVGSKMGTRVWVRIRNTNGNGDSSSNK